MADKVRKSSAVKTQQSGVSKTISSRKNRKFRHAPVVSLKPDTIVKKKSGSSGTQTKIAIPKKSDEASANWKFLSELLKNGKTTPNAKTTDKRQLKQKIGEKSNTIDESSVKSMKSKGTDESGVQSKKSKGTDKSGVQSKKSKGTDKSGVKPTKSKGADESGTKLKKGKEQEVKHNQKKSPESVKRKIIVAPADQVKSAKKSKLSVEAEPEETEMWFDGVDEILLEASKEKKTLESDKSTNLIKEAAYRGLTKTVAMDCEMVGVGFNDESVLARVSIVNHFGHCVYDRFVKAGEKVTNYRTHVSGVRKENLKDAEEFSTVQQEVKDIFRGRTIVGHSLHNDLTVLYIKHPRKKIRDTAKYKGFRALFDGRTPSLKNLAAKLLGISIQTGEHSSVTDAQVAMRLYTMFKKKWEEDWKTTTRVKKNPSELKKEKKEREKAENETIKTE